MKTIRKDTQQPIPLTAVHVWRVVEWHDGRWDATRNASVQTWSRDRSLARRKAIAGCPALARCRFKIEHDRINDISNLGLALDPAEWGGRWTPSHVVPDRYGEYRTLLRERARAKIRGAAPLD